MESLSTACSVSSTKVCSVCGATRCETLTLVCEMIVSVSLMSFITNTYSFFVSTTSLLASIFTESCSCALQLRTASRGSLYQSSLATSWALPYVWAVLVTALRGAFCIFLCPSFWILYSLCWLLRFFGNTFFLPFSTQNMHGIGIWQAASDEYMRQVNTSIGRFNNLFTFLLSHSTKKRFEIRCR